MFSLLLILIISTTMSLTISTTPLMCHVCGCPDGEHDQHAGDVVKEGVDGPGDKTVSYEDCTGQCLGELGVCSIISSFI